MAKVGYLPSPEMGEEAFNGLRNHPLFEQEAPDPVACSSLDEAVKRIHSGELDYILLPSRTIDNHPNLDFLGLISRLSIDNLVEIGLFTCQVPGLARYVHKSEEGSRYKNKVGDEENEPVLSFLEGEGEDNPESIEFRLFKLNDYRRPWHLKIKNFFGSHLTASFLIRLLSALVSVVITVLLFLSTFLHILPEANEDLISAIGTVLVVIMNIVLGMSGFDEGNKNSLITGKWIYYSFEEKKDGLSFVPRGLRLRVVDIRYSNKELSLNCHFVGEDILFFSADSFVFGFDPKDRVGKGFYHYSSNVSNNSGKRAEGNCQFVGQLTKNGIVTMDGWFFSRGTALSGRVRFYRLSEKDAALLDKSRSFYSVKKPSAHLVGIFGYPKSNTDLAFKKCLEDPSLDLEDWTRIFFDDFVTMRKYLDAGFIDYCLVPVKNQAKPLGAYEAFADLTPVKTFDEPIIYCLASRRELSKELLDSPDTVFVSKKEALEQCSLFLKVKKTKEASSTSEAAKALSEANADSSITYVAICNGEAAKAYGLKTYMVGEEVFNPSDAQADNKTTFNLYKAPKPKKDE